jgi:hypothetical protein
VHLDGYNFMPYFQGKVSAAPRDSILYFDQDGSLDAIRWNDWKLSFASIDGNIATGTRALTNWPLVWNLRMDPYERGFAEGGENTKFASGQMWLLVPIQEKIKDFFGDYEKYPHQEGSSLSVGNLGYGTLRQAELMKRLQDMETMSPP